MEMTLAYADDWVGIYVGDALITEGHSIDTCEAARLAVKYQVVDIVARDVDLDWIHDEGNLPKRIEDVVWDSATQVTEAA